MKPLRDGSRLRESPDFHLRDRATFPTLGDEVLRALPYLHQVKVLNLCWLQSIPNAALSSTHGASVSLPKVAK